MILCGKHLAGKGKNKKERKKVYDNIPEFERHQASLRILFAHYEGKCEVCARLGTVWLKRQPEAEAWLGSIGHPNRELRQLPVGRGRRGCSPRLFAGFRAYGVIFSRHLRPDGLRNLGRRKATPGAISHILPGLVEGEGSRSKYA